jgi:hypothetical protein
MERALTAMPSLRSSPRIRSVPQCGLSAAMVAIRVRTSGVRRGRPKGQPDRQRQNRRQPLRCQRSTVSGRTKSRWRRQLWWMRRTTSQKSLSRAWRRGRRWEQSATWSLLAEEQVLEEEALTAAEGASKGGEEEADEFDHLRQDRGSSPPPTGPVRLLLPYNTKDGLPVIAAAVGVFARLMAPSPISQSSQGGS